MAENINVEGGTIVAGTRHHHYDSNLVERLAASNKKFKDHTTWPLISSP